MKIIEINIKCFGKLKDFVLKPADGINIIYGKNEAGKSTVMAFIKAMFYGLDSGVKRMQYEPWDGGQPSGSIEFEYDGSVYFLNRTFGSAKGYDKISLFDKTNGEAVPLSPGQEPGALMLGINIKSFVNSAFIGQAGIPVEGDNYEIVSKLVNLTSAGDEHISKKEIDKRLNNAAAQLDSKKSSSILPELRKQKHELIETRKEIQKVLDESDILREKIAVDYRQRKTLKEDQAFLEEMNDRLIKRSELEEIEAILRKRDEVEELEEKFNKLDGLFNGELVDGMSEFLSTSAKLLNEEKAKETALQDKVDELEDLRRQAVSIDRPKLAMIKTIKKYTKEISIGFEQYDSLISEKNELERMIEQQQEPEEKPDDLRLVAGICIAVAVAAVILGIAAHWVFYIIGVIAVLSIVVYMSVYKKSIDDEDLISDEELSLSNVNEQLCALNDEMRHILSEFGVQSMDEFDRLYKEIEHNQKKYLEAKNKKDKLETTIAEMNEDLEGVREKLRDNLAKYHETESSEEASDIISKLSSMKREHEKLSFQLASARDMYQFMLKSRNIDEMKLYHDQLLNGVDLKVPDSFTLDNIKSKISAVNQQLEEMNHLIAREETELQLKPYNAQNVQAISDDIKAINRRIEHYEFELSAIQLAQNTLNEAFKEMQIDFGPMINYRATRVLSGMTGNKSSSILVSDKLIPTFAEQGDSQPRSSEVMGAGTYDQIYLSLRLALAGVITDDKLPIMLDDSFVQFDDDRMTDALRFIKEDNALGEIGQVIIFTCHKRMINAAKKLELTDSVFSM